MPARPSVSALLLLLILWLVWGASWVVSKAGLAYATPLQMVQYRLLLAVLTLGGLWVWRGRKEGFRRPPFWPTLWLGLTQTTGFTLLSTLALLQTGTGKVTILCYTMPFWTVLLARFFLRELVRKVQWVAVSLALAGLLLVLAPWQQQPGGTGSVLAIAAGICWAVSAIIARRLHVQQATDTLSLTFWQLLFGLIPLYLLSFGWSQPPVDWQWPFVGILLFNGCIAAGLGWLIWLHLLSRLSAGTAGLNMLAIPAVALVGAWWWMGDVPTPWEWGGMALIGIALGLLAVFNYWLDREPLTVQ